MVAVPGGTFLMGADDFYPEERPAHPVVVDGFWIDEHPVTNAEYRRFVTATGYRTVAERPLERADYPAADPSPRGAETCLYTNIEDDAFVTERHGPIVVCSACSGHGFKFAPAVGTRVAALVESSP